MKAFAILLLETLSVKRFDSRDELRVALDAVQASGKPFRVFRWHAGAGFYAQCEVAEL